MIIDTIDANRWLARGWTTDKLRERMAGCVVDAKHYRNYPAHTRYSYRMINANLYRKYKFVLCLLLGANNA